MKLFVMDLMNLAMRAYHGFGRSSDGLLATSEGKFTYVCYGVALAFNKIMQDYQPDAIIVCTDTKGRTFRHEMYEGYKSNRKPAEENFAVQLPDLFKMVELYGFPLVRREATEADDLIGTIARKFGSKDCHVTIVSGDKDYMQLVGERVSILKPENMGSYRQIGVEGVYEKFGVGPAQVIDALAIIGDAADMVPGVAGIGEKGATALLKSFGTLESVYGNLGMIKPALQRKLVKSMEMAFLSKKLVTIDCDVPIEIDLESAKVRPNVLQDPELRKFFAEMEFRSFLFEGSDIIGDSGSIGANLYDSETL